jgi:DNA polymerase-3 subunit epsilon
MELEHPDWAVVDIETTGLHPARDRIIEIAVVQVDDAGVPGEEWTTLLDPETHALGRVHGIEVSDLAGAPRFGDVVDELLWRLSGRVLVAHNVAFDIAFLTAEANRAGIAWGPVEGFCTMEITQRLGMVKARKLDACCQELGIPTGRRHAALDDARAVASILGRLQPQVWALTVPRAAQRWSEPVARARLLPRRRAPTSESATRLGMLGPAIQIPREVGGLAASTGAMYLALLDRVLEDRRITESEREALELFASTFGIGRAAAREVHRAYLDEMWRSANADGVITPEERGDLEALTVLLTAALPH